MYPDFRYLIHGIIGIWPPGWVSLFKTFGLMVAVAFICGSVIIVRELKRKEKEGLLQPEVKEIETGKPVTLQQIFLNALGGFLLGFKAGGFISNWQAISPDPAAYVFSAKGNLLGGLILALVFAGLKYVESLKKKEAPGKKKVLVYPHQRIGEVVILAALGGIVGAKVFNALETWDDFIQDPIASLTSSSGLTFYGGLIVATAVLYFFARKNKIRFAYLCDCAAPAIMLAYGIGRLGCQLSGDGDWGINNSAYVSMADGTLKEAGPADYQLAITQNAAHYQQAFPDLNHIPALHVTAGWLPRVLVAQNFPHNVNNTGMAISGCTMDHCSVLPVSVFPTSLYEAFACALLFLVLWGLRRKLKRPWQMFGMFLFFSGAERFLIEQIRVNTKYDLGFIHPTQAEIIAVLLMICGVSLFIKALKKDTEHQSAPEV